MIEFGSENKEIWNNCKTAPFLLKLEDSSEESLRVVIAFPMYGKDDTVPDDCPGSVRALLAQSKPVLEDKEEVYEIVFDNYIIYQNRNESYTAWDDYEVRKGKYLIIFDRSRLLDYYENVLFDFDNEDTKKNRRKHYGIYTQRHILDIISNSEPRIRKIGIEP